MSDREATRDRDREDDVRRREGVEADPHGTGNFIKKPQNPKTPKPLIYYKLIEFSQ